MVTAPSPVMVLAAACALLLEKASVVPVSSVTVPVPSAPALAPLPTCSVPPLTSVVPL